MQVTRNPTQYEPIKIEIENQEEESMFIKILQCAKFYGESETVRHCAIWILKSFPFSQSIDEHLTRAIKPNSDFPNVK